MYDCLVWPELLKVEIHFDFGFHCNIIHLDAGVVGIEDKVVYIESHQCSQCRRWSLGSFINKYF